MFTNDNTIIQTFLHGGPIMWPILITGILAIAAVAERTFWWLREVRRRRPNDYTSVFNRLSSGDIEGAIHVAGQSSDARLKVVHYGLTHRDGSMEQALEIGAGLELERAEKWIAVMDTVITLAPLLGLLGTVTGIMHSFSFVGNEELAATKVSGGIAEALIATAAGLGIAIVTLIPMNYFNRRVEKLRFELETVATRVQILFERARSLV